MIVYVDGSYKNQKGGWGFLYFYSSAPREPNYGFGTCILENSNQAEILACIKALESIVINESVEYIEIRTDYMGLVDTVNRIDNDYYMFYRSIANAIDDKNLKMYLKLIKIIMNTDYNVKFVKASKRDSFIKRVHGLAKNAMKNTPINENEYFLWSKQDNRFQVHRQKDEDIDNEFCINNNQAIADHMEIDIAKVELCEELHLKTQTLHFNGLLYKSKKSNSIDTPIVVKKTSQGRYKLVMGLRSYCAAKILGISKVKAILVDISEKESFKQSV